MGKPGLHLFEGFYAKDLAFGFLEGYIFAIEMTLCCHRLYPASCKPVISVWSIM